MTKLLTIAIPVYKYDLHSRRSIVDCWSQEITPATGSLIEIIICYKESSIVPINFTLANGIRVSHLLQDRDKRKIYGAMNQILSYSRSHYIAFMGVNDYVSTLDVLIRKLSRFGQAGPKIVFMHRDIKDWLKSFIFPIASEACHQQLIYKSHDLNGYNHDLDVNADHLANIDIFTNSANCSIGRFHCNYITEPGGVSSVDQDPYYFHYRICQPLLTPLKHAPCKFIFWTSLFLRSLFRRDKRLQKIRSTGLFHVLVISNRVDYLLQCLSSLNESYRSLSHSKARLFTANILVDDRSIHIDEQKKKLLMAEASIFGSIVFFNGTSLDPQKTGRAELRNFLVSRIKPDKHDTLVFIDGDLLLPKILLSSIERYSKNYPWGQFPVHYLDHGTTKNLLDSAQSRLLIDVYRLPLAHYIKTLFSLFKKRTAVLSRRILGVRANKYIGSYSPTLQSGCLFINYQVYESVNGFENLHPDPLAWGTEDAYLGYKLYKHNLLPKMFGSFNTAFHLYHDPVSPEDRLSSKILLKRLI